jgi:hypothetical protein
MGLDRTQALSRASELGSSDYYDRQRDQIESQRRERRAVELRSIEAGRPGMLSDIEAESPGLSAGVDVFRSARRGLRDTYENIAHGSPDISTSFGSREARQRYDRYASSHGLEALQGAGSPGETGGWGSRFQADREIYGASGASGALLGIGSAISATFGDDTARQREVQGLRRLGRMGQDITHTSASEAMGARRTLARQGLDEDAAAAFGNAIGSVSSRPTSAMGGALGAGAANLMVRGGSQLLTMGLVDPGNVAGSRATSEGDIRSAFANTMRSRGVVAARATPV